MTNIIDETVKNLCEVGESTLANRIRGIKPMGMDQALTCTRHLVVPHGSRETLHLKLRADIVSSLWGYVPTDDEGSRLRAGILICIEQLVRGSLNIEEIEPELLVLAAARDASFETYADLRAVTKLVVDMDFNGLKKALVSTAVSASSYTQVVGKARFYAKSGSMAGVDYDTVYEKTSKVEK